MLHSRTEGQPVSNLCSRRRKLRNIQMYLRTSLHYADLRSSIYAVTVLFSKRIHEIKGNINENLFREIEFQNRKALLQNFICIFFYIYKICDSIILIRKLKRRNFFARSSMKDFEANYFNEKKFPLIEKIRERILA